MGHVRLEAITWDRLGDLLAERLLDLKPADGSPWPRIAFDGAPAARPGDLAERVAEALRVRGRPSLTVGAEGFLRPASVRLEYGHHDVDAYYDGWLDTGALWREVFGPLEPGGGGRVLPELWDPVNARARVQSPNANVADYPVPIPGTDLSVVCFKVRNASPQPNDSRITAIGFDVPGEATGYALIGPLDSAFHLIEQVSNVPELHGTTLDFALVTGRTFGGGQPNAGLPPSSTLTTFCVSGPFPQNQPIERLIDSGVVRMQRVGPDGESGDVLVWESRPL